MSKQMINILSYPNDKICVSKIPSYNTTYVYTTLCNHKLKIVDTTVHDL